MLSDERGIKMKIKDGYMLRNIADTWIVVPLGEKVVELNGIISLTESGALLWKKLINGADIEELKSALMQEYDVDEQTALNDCMEFSQSIQQHNLCE